MPHVAHCTWLGWCNGSVRALVQRAGALFCIGFALRFYVLSTIVYTVNNFCWCYFCGCFCCYCDCCCGGGGSGGGGRGTFALGVLTVMATGFWL